MRDNFKDRANKWDDNPVSQLLSKSGYEYIKSNILFSKDSKLIDLGGGTGALALNFLDDVADITVVDTSKAMLDVLKEKIELNGLTNVNTIEGELVEGTVANDSVDLVVSSMALHHIEDVYKQLEDIYTALSDGGQIAIIDLLEESGDFHPEGLDYVHNGFAKEDILDILEFSKFINVRFKVFEHVEKMGSKGKLKDYPVFIVTAEK